MSALTPHGARLSFPRVRRLILLIRLLFWKPTVVVSTPPTWEPNRPKKDGYNWIPVGNIPEPVPITLLYSKGGRGGRVLIKSAHANREGIIYFDCDESRELRRVRANYVGQFVDDDGLAIEPREFLSSRLSIPLWQRSIRAKAPHRGWGRGGLKSMALALALIIVPALSAGTAEKLADIGAIQPAVDQFAMQPKWQNIEITEASRRNYSLTIWYREEALVLKGEPERDTRSVARAVLAALVKGGRKPADEDVTLFVSAQRPARGETGAARVVWYGYSTYDYNSDSLTYKACDGKGWFGC